MPKNVVTYEFLSGTNAYITDFGQELSRSKRFNAPPDFTDVTITQVLQAVGATRRAEPTICSDNGFGKLRYLKFIRRTGNSFSLAFAARENLISVATSVKSIVDALSGGSNVVDCIELIGEDYNNLNDVLGLNYDGNAFAPTHTAPNSAGKQNFISGAIAYNTDASSVFGLSVNQSIRMITEKATNEYPAQLGGAATNCVGDILSVLSCGNGKRNPRQHRYAELKFSTKSNLTNEDEAAQTEDLKIPIAGHAPNDIFSCLQSLANLPGVYCVGYHGENFKRVHSLL